MNKHVHVVLLYLTSYIYFKQNQQQQYGIEIKINSQQFVFKMKTKNWKTGETIDDEEETERDGRKKSVLTMS